MRLQEESGMMDSRTRGNSELGSYFVNQHRGQWVALGSALLLLVGAIDFATGMKLRLTELYLVALLVLTWGMGRLFGLLMAVLACTSWAYIDCDNFKVVNDKFGHHVGDELLRVISKTMLRKLRSSDLPGRLGGDEFAVMLPETNAEACRMVIEMLQQRLLHEMKAHNWPVTFSIGIATFLRMPASIEDMIRQADKLMYAVKNSSKGAIKQEVFHG